MIDIREYWRVLRRWWWVIVAICLTCGATAVVVTLQLPKTYASTTVALVSPKQVVDNPNANPGQLPNLDQLVATYVGLVNTEPVRQRLSSSGVPRSADALSKNISAVRVPGTTLINITAKDSDPAVALVASQLVIPAFNQSLDELQSKVPGSNQNSHLDSLVPWDVPTQRPGSPISPNIPTIVGLAVGAGLVLSIGLVFLLERLDTTIKNDTDVRLKLGLPLLGTVVYRPLAKNEIKVGDDLERIAAIRAKDPIVEQYRAIRTNIMFSLIDEPLHTIVVTSTLPREGKTTTACNLAVVMAQAGNRVVLVDADFRKPSVHRVFGLEHNLGVANLLLDEGPLSDFLAPTPVPNLQLLCSGPSPPNPSELIGSTAMEQLIARVQETADVLIFDTPPVGAVTDATVLGAMSDGLVLVVEQGRTPIQAISRSIETLEAVGVKPLGVVLNKSQAAEPYPYGTDEAIAAAPPAAGARTNVPGQSPAGSREGA